jgi:LL-diaminopimelate aminotransferase
MAGRTSAWKNGRYEGFVYLESTEANDYVPALPTEKVDVIYLCFPNNPTGRMITKAQLRPWVEYARENKALILYDAAYVEFIRDDSLPQSIYEIEGAQEVAIEFRSFSKTAGSPERAALHRGAKALQIYDSAGNAHSLHPFWDRRRRPNLMAYRPVATRCRGGPPGG